MSAVQFNGDELLKVLNSLNVSIGSLHPNVIRAWFDSDCPKTVDLLNWICTAIGPVNYIPALDKFEFEEIKEPLNGKELDEECEKLEITYPGLFEFDSDFSDIEFLEEELKFLEERNSNLDSQLSMHRHLSENLNKEIASLQSVEILTHVEKEEEQEACLKLNRELDEANSNLFERICNYQQHLKKFICEEQPEFVNCLDISALDEEFKTATKLVFSMVRIKNDSMSSTASTTRSFQNDLNEIRDSLLQSYITCSRYQLDESILRETKKFLQNVNASISYNMLQVDEDLEDLDSMKERNSLLLEMLEKTVENFVDIQANRSKLKSTEDEVINQEFLLVRNMKIERILMKIFSIYAVLRILLNQEKADIDSCDRFFQNVFIYIQYDISASVKRQGFMFEILDNYEEFKLKSVENQLPLVQELRKLLNVDISKGLPDILKKYQHLEDELNKIESKMYGSDIENHLKSANSLNEHLRILKKFIFDGPTNQIVSIPPMLHLKFKGVDSLTKKQQVAVKLGVQIWNDYLKRVDAGKWAVYRRQFWMHYLENPGKAQSIIDDLEKEVKSKENI